MGERGPKTWLPPPASAGTVPPSSRLRQMRLGCPGGGSNASSMSRGHAGKKKEGDYLYSARPKRRPPISGSASTRAISGVAAQRDQTRFSTQKRAESTVAECAGTNISRSAHSKRTLTSQEMDGPARAYTKKMVVHYAVSRV